LKKITGLEIVCADANTPLEMPEKVISVKAAIKALSIVIFLFFVNVSEVMISP
jgi:hypothetical protein